MPTKLMAETFDKDMIDKDEHPRTQGRGQTQNLSQLKAIVQYHVLPDTDLKLAQVVSGQEYRTAEGQYVVLSIVDGTTMVNDATVVQVVEGGAWTIYVIDQVLTPPVAGASPSP